MKRCLLYLSLFMTSIATFIGCKEKEEEIPFVAEVNISASSIEFSADGESKSLEITANTSWSISNYPDWVEISSLSGDGDATITFTAGANESIEALTAELHIVAEDDIDKSLMLSQLGVAPMLACGSDIIECDKAEATVMSFELESNCDWIISVPEEVDWFEVLPSEGSGSATISVNIFANSEVETRSAEFSISAADLTPLTIEVSQVGVPVMLDVDADELKFTALGGSESFNIDTNSAWEVSIPGDCDWLEVTPSSGKKGEYEVVVSAEAYSGDENRTAEIEVVAFGVPHKISVTQATPSVTAVGDFYYADGTTSINNVATADNPIVGVVYKVNDEGSAGMAFSISQDNLIWSTSQDEVTGAADIDNGLANMATLMAYEDFATHFPAANYCATYNGQSDVDYTTAESGVWYLPAKNELLDLYNICKENDKFADKVTQAGGDQIEAEWYWSSSEQDSMGAQGGSFGWGMFSSATKTTSKYVRPVIKF